MLEGFGCKRRSIEKGAGIKPEQKLRVFNLVCRGAFLETPEVAFLYRRSKRHLVARGYQDRFAGGRQGLELEDNLAEAGLGLLLEAVGPQHVEQDFAAFAARFPGGEICQKRLATAQRNRDYFRPAFRERELTEQLQLHCPAPFRLFPSRNNVEVTPPRGGNDGGITQIV